MNLFQSKESDKNQKRSSNQFFIDYSKPKAGETFLQEFFEYITENENALFLVDGSLFYEKNQSKREKLFMEMKSKLTESGFDYKETITKRDADNRVLGIRINSSEQVDNYQVAVVVQQYQIREVVSILMNYNFFCCITKEESLEKLSDYYKEVRGDLADLKEASDYYLYHDNFFQRISVYSKVDLGELVDSSLKKVKKMKKTS